jgi:hypothetical protein
MQFRDYRSNACVASDSHASVLWRDLIEALADANDDSV